MAVLSSFFGLLALTLSAIGLYGVLAYGVSQRTSEIGIRMALGADRAKILTMVLGETGRMLIVGISIGLVISLGATRLITSLLFGITPNDARSFAVGTIVLLVVALVATMLPAKRAVDVDPMMALRYE
jgi:ABC-type antimicrobial peptide transport system permease subunit